MKNQQTQKSETLEGHAKKINSRFRLLMMGFGFGLIVVLLLIILPTLLREFSSRPSTPSEIEAQKEFQQKLNIKLKEYQNTIDSVNNTAEQSWNSNGK